MTKSHRPVLFRNATRRGAPALFSVMLVTAALGCSGNSNLGGDAAAAGKGGAQVGSSAAKGGSNSAGAGASSVGAATGMGGASAIGGGASVGGASAIGGASTIGGTAAKGGATAIGGASTVGGNINMGGAAIAGGTPAGGATNRGGASAIGGNVGVGGTNSGGASTLLECKTSADCQLVGDCCGCHSLPLGRPSDCPMDCLSSTTCSGFAPQPAPTCVHGRCVLDRSCDDASGTLACLIATPTCAAGKLPTLNSSFNCYDGNCVDVPECLSVRSCADCTGPNQICVIDNGARAVYHCVEVAQSCMLASRCACYAELCGNMLPCAEHAKGIYCGGG